MNKTVIPIKDIKLAEENAVADLRFANTEKLDLLYTLVEFFNKCFENSNLGYYSYIDFYAHKSHAEINIIFKELHFTGSELTDIFNLLSLASMVCIEPVDEYHSQLIVMIHELWNVGKADVKDNEQNR